MAKPGYPGGSNMARSVSQGGLNCALRPANRVADGRELSPACNARVRRNAHVRRAQILERSRTILGRNTGLIDAWVARWDGRLRYVRPAAGGMVFVGYDFPINSTELGDLIRERESTFVVAGDWFGMDGYLRIGIGGHAHELEEGLRRIDRVLQSL